MVLEGEPLALLEARSRRAAGLDSRRGAPAGGAEGFGSFEALYLEATESLR